MKPEFLGHNEMQKNHDQAQQVDERLFTKFFYPSW